MPIIPKAQNWPSTFPWIPTVFIMCTLYWFFLAATSQLVIAHDAIGYEELGRLIVHQGFGEYLTSGPHREPLYPLFVSLTMRLANATVSYQTILILFQLLLLLITQLLTLILLRKLNINNFLLALCLLYIGVSPALINSSLILYSEILTYPFILGVILLSDLGFESIRARTLSTVIIYALLLGLDFLALVFCKDIFELVTPFFLGIFLFWIIKNNRSLLKHACIFIFTTLITFSIPVYLYKCANLKKNGHFALTNRGAWALYGNTARRVEPINPKRFVAALAFVPSWKFCQSVCGVDDCEWWSFIPSDNLGAQKRNELEKKFPAQEIDSKFIQLSFEKLLSNPFQYLLLYIIESFKMLFWESLSMQYIYYPSILIKIYLFAPFYWICLVVMPALTLISFFYLIKQILWNRIKDPDVKTVLLLIFTFIVLYMIFLSFFYILPRYIFPIVSLILISITYLFQNIFTKETSLPLQTKIQKTKMGSLK